MYKRVLLAALGMHAAFTVYAQPAQQGYKAEVSMPFGTANGTLVTSGEYLIFVNDQLVERSFVVERDNVQNVNFENGIMSVALQQPMRNEFGESSRLSFRFSNPGDADSVVRWSRTASADRSVVAKLPDTAPAAGGQQFSFEVKHNHRMGSCTGRLIVTGDRVTYESLTDINDSRQWSMRDLKEIGHQSPYTLDIKPFTGNEYSFELLGGGMKSEDYSALTKAIAAARAGQ